MLLSGFAYQAVEAERRARLAERGSRMQAEVRQLVDELDAAFRSPVDRLRSEVEARVDPVEAGQAVLRLVLVQPLLERFFVLGAHGERAFPAGPARRPPNPWPSHGGGLGGGILGSTRPQDPEHLLKSADAAVLGSTVDSADAALVDVSRRGPTTAARATALFELARLHEGLGGVRHPVIALEAYTTLADFPITLVDLRGRLAAALGRFQLARSDLIQETPRTQRAETLLDELRESAYAIPADALAQLCERTGALLAAHDDGALKRAREVAVERQQTESQCARLQEQFGRVLQEALREGALPGISGGNLEGSSPDAPVPFVKARAGAHYEILTYALMRREPGERPAGLVAVRVNQSAAERAFRKIVERAGGELIRREEDGVAAAEGVISAPLRPPFDHLRVRLNTSESDVPLDSTLGLPRETAQLWAIFLSLVGIAAGIFVTVLTVRRESKAAQLKSDFVSNVTHELKTPLTSIQMFLDTLLLGRVTDEAEAQECLEVMSRETQRLTRLIEQLLVFSRIENKKWRVRFIFASAQELVSESIEVLAGNLGKQPEELGIEIVAIQETPKVPVDRFAIKEALINLLHNAIKYSPNEDRKVRVVITSRRRFVELAVEDNGMGVPRRDRRRIFVKFERGSNAEKGRIEGSGIGLTLANEIAKAHGGSIRYTALKPRGSRFSVLLPK